VVLGCAYMHCDSSRAWAREAGGVIFTVDAKGAACAKLRNGLLDYSVGPVVLLGDSMSVWDLWQMWTQLFNLLNSN
jgi:hypothetical protein